MSKEILYARLKSINEELQLQTNYLERAVSDDFDEMTVCELRAAFTICKRRVEKFDELINLLEETKEYFL